MSISWVTIISGVMSNSGVNMICLVVSIAGMTGTSDVVSNNEVDKDMSWGVVSMIGVKSTCESCSGGNVASVGF